MENAIIIKNLKKSYGDIRAVDDISLTISKGSIFAFLGCNGAGKSTTINIICTLLAKDSGEVNVFGYNLDNNANKIRESIGVVFQNSVLDKKLSVKDNLSIRAAFYGLRGKSWAKRLDELCHLLDLDDLLIRKYGKLSGGQRRRVDVARALVNEPQILILDEPTTGLDPQTRIKVWSIVEQLREEKGVTIFLTTHYMEESNVADKVVIIDAGKIVAEGSPIELKDKYSSDKIYVYSEQTEQLNEALVDYSYKYEDNCYKISVANSDIAKELLINCGSLISNFEVVKGNMDDVFLNVTGKTLDGGNAL